MEEKNERLKEIFKTMTPEELADLKIESEEIIMEADELIAECDEALNS